VIKPAVFRDIIRSIPGADKGLRNVQARAVKWFWSNRLQQIDFSKKRKEDLERRFNQEPSDPVAALLLTAAK
jgi:hypothetical protein